ncbi:MAG: hypothetical protein P4L31_00415, partial [Candidatus Babeliales bacterium]|nr:hypothetical protein [Candidatus Babeliales bacterium]
MAASKKTYATEQAQVRTGTDLCQQENNFTSTRISHVKASLEKILNIPLTDKQVPRIAICASGGGYRAALTMLGALDGSDMPIAQNGSKNLLDITTYLAAVSGSASVAAGMAYTHKTPSESINHIAPLINKSLLSDFSMVDLALALKRKTQHGQSISFIDLFGSLMAQRTFKGLGIDHPSSIDLATYASQIDPLKSPLPIQTSIIGNNTSGKYEWVEFTPFEIGSTFLNTFIPSWAFGRKFENGLSIDFTPPQSLAFCMGLWGSAMCANPHDFFKIRIAPELDPIVSSFVAPQLEQLFTRPPFSNVRLSPAHVFNWNLGMQNATLNKHKTLTLVDAGFDSNFPLPPLLRSER